MSRRSSHAGNPAHKFTVIAFVLSFSLLFPSIAWGSDIIENGSFASDPIGWYFSVEGKGQPTGTWTASGYTNGGAVCIESEIGARKRGTGYWEQTLAQEIAAGSTVTLSYAWRKGYSSGPPSQQNLSIVLVKPSGAEETLDSQDGAPGAYDTWYTVADKAVSHAFDETGIYTIRLRYQHKTGTLKSCQAFAWFDEVTLLVGQPEADWVDRSPTPNAGGYGEAVTGTGDSIYVIRCLNASATPQFWRYDSSGDTWVSLSTDGLAVGEIRNGAVLAWDQGDSIYALSGARYGDPDRRAFYRYSIASDQWTSLADTPHAQGAGDALIWSGYDYRFYSFLGSKEHGTAFAQYNPETNSWALLTAPPSGTDDGASLAWAGDERLFAIRGEYIETEPLQDFWQYDIISDTWTSREPIPDGGGVGDGGSLIWIGTWAGNQADYLYALGGCSANEDPGYSFFRYSISGDSWEVMPDIPHPVGYYNGARMGFAEGYIHYWQGSPTSWPGGGDRFARYEGNNSPPVASDDAYGMDEDGYLSVGAPGVLANDADADEDPLSAVLVSGTSHGALSLNANGSFSYTPDANYNGMDSFTYKANDGKADSNTATVTITINPVNDIPNAVDDEANTAEETAVTIDVVANDSDGDDDPLTVTSVTQGSHGSVVNNGDDTVTYTPEAGFVGMDTFTYTVDDGNGGSDAATVTVTVQSGGPTTMHVGDLDGSPMSNKNQWSAAVTVLVVDTYGNPVADAEVSGAWSGGCSGTSSAVTDENGLCSVTSDSMRKNVESVTFTVTNVVHATLTYESADNEDPDGDSDGTTITVYKP
jgi:VCBS repeat-containing protein